MQYLTSNSDAFALYVQSDRVKKSRLIIALSPRQLRSACTLNNDYRNRHNHPSKWSAVKVSAKAAQSVMKAHTFLMFLFDTLSC
jgi:hypothetical protein